MVPTNSVHKLSQRSTRKEFKASQVPVSARSITCACRVVAALFVCIEIGSIHSSLGTGICISTTSTSCVLNATALPFRTTRTELIITYLLLPHQPHAPRRLKKILLHEHAKALSMQSPNSNSNANNNPPVVGGTGSGQEQQQQQQQPSAQQQAQAPEALSRS